MAKKPPPRKNHKDAGRKKKVSVLTTEKVDYIDYKDVNLLKRFVSDRSKVRARRVTGNDTQQQAEVARAIKNAREMALMPYAVRVTTQRNNRDRGRDRGPRDGAPREERSDSPEGDENAMGSDDVMADMGDVDAPTEAPAEVEAQADVEAAPVEAPAESTEEV